MLLRSSDTEGKDGFEKSAFHRRRVLSALFPGGACACPAGAGGDFRGSRGRLIDVRTGRVSTNAYILIAKDRILRTTDSAPAGISNVDLSRYTVVPGLIDSHTHVLGNQKDQSSAAGLRMSSAQKALWGFTALRDAGEDDPGYAQLALRDSIDRGLIRGPRMVSAGNFVSVNGGHGDADVLAPDQQLARRPNSADTVDDVSRAVRRDIK
jgi:imidazolonepropionase-like amidohydrolase